MLEWHDFVEQLLSEESSFDGISLSFDGTAHSVGVPPIIKASFTLENAKPKVKENVSDEECFFQCKFKLFSEKGFSPLSKQFERASILLGKVLFARCPKKPTIIY